MLFIVTATFPNESEDRYLVSADNEETAIGMISIAYPRCTLNTCEQALEKFLQEQYSGVAGLQVF